MTAAAYRLTYSRDVDRVCRAERALEHVRFALAHEYADFGVLELYRQRSKALELVEADAELTHHILRYRDYGELAAEVLLHELRDLSLELHPAERFHLEHIAVYPRKVDVIAALHLRRYLMRARSRAVIAEAARIRGYPRIQAHCTVLGDVHAHILPEVVDYLARRRRLLAQQRLFRVVPVGLVVVDTELYLVSVYLGVPAHELYVRDINGDDGLGLEFLARSHARHKVIARGENVAAHYAAAYAQLRKDVFQSESRADTVAVRTLVSDYDRVLAVAQEGLCLTETNIHRCTSLVQY